MSGTGGIRKPVAVTGLDVLSAFGPGPGLLAHAVAVGRPGFTRVTRFDVGGRGAARAAQLPGTPDLAGELASVIGEAWRTAGLSARDARDTPLLLALHGDPHTAGIAAQVAADVTRHCALPGVERIYTCACVAASTALAHAASRIACGVLERAVVAAGYLLEPGMFAVFDAGRALTGQEQPRPFSRDRDGLLLGDAVVAVVLESEDAARARDADVLALLSGWGSAGDAYHVCRPDPGGAGLARAVEMALARAGVDASQIDYINANASGSTLGDEAEAAALHAVFGADPVHGGPQVSSTKSVHGHALEASALLEFAVTVLAVRGGMLPMNAGYLGPDERCRLNLVLDGPRRAEPRYALSVNSAFGGANTALLVEAA